MLERNANERRNWLIPYACGLAFLVIAHLTSLATFGSSMPTLSALLAIISAILGYFLCRVIQMRGRATLAMIVIGMPILTAITFLAFSQIAPFANRQTDYQQLTSHHIQCGFVKAKRVGEWIQDEQGNTLPTWIAERIGSDCASELRWISGDLADYQMLDYQSIDGSTIQSVLIHRDGSNQKTLSEEFADWLLSLPQLSGISISHDFQFGDESQVVIESSVRLVAAVLEDEPMGAIGSHFRLNVADLSAEEMTSLSKLPRNMNLQLRGTTLNAVQIEAFAAQEIGILFLVQVGLPNLKSIPAADLPRIRQLEVCQNVTYDQLRDLTRIFQCEVISVEMMNVDEGQIEAFWHSEQGAGLRKLEVHRPVGDSLTYRR